MSRSSRPLRRLSKSLVASLPLPTSCCPFSQGSLSQLRCVVIHPKAMPRSRLMGYREAVTGEWKDGVLSRLTQELEKDESGNVWVVFDGDIDPEWAENLNSVLDDNHVLTLPTGRRFYLDSQRVKFIFETHQLTFASPATTSRYMNPDNSSGVRPLSNRVLH